MPTSFALTGAPLTLTLLITIPSISAVQLLTTSPSTPANAFTKVLSNLTYSQPLHLLFALSLLYQLRPIERLWGTRKLSAFLTSTGPLLLVLQAGSQKLFGSWTGVESEGGGSGRIATALLFSLLAQWCEMVPFDWRYGLGNDAHIENEGGGSRPWQIEPSNKWQTYMIAGQVGIANMSMAIGGWAAGWAWRRDLIPGSGIVKGVFGVKTA